MVSQIWMNTSKWQACAGSEGSEDAGRPTAAVALTPQHSRVNDAMGERTILIIITIAAADDATPSVSVFVEAEKSPPPYPLQGKWTFPP